MRRRYCCQQLTDVFAKVWKLAPGTEKKKISGFHDFFFLRVSFENVLTVDLEVTFFNLW